MTPCGARRPTGVGVCDARRLLAAKSRAALRDALRARLWTLPLQVSYASATADWGLLSSFFPLFFPFFLYFPLFPLFFPFCRWKGKSFDPKGKNLKKGKILTRKGKNLRKGKNFILRPYYDHYTTMTTLHSVYNIQREKFEKREKSIHQHTYSRLRGSLLPYSHSV